MRDFPLKHHTRLFDNVYNIFDIDVFDIILGSIHNRLECEII